MKKYDPEEPLGCGKWFMAAMVLLVVYFARYDSARRNRNHLIVGTAVALWFAYDRYGDVWRERLSKWFRRTR